MARKRLGNLGLSGERVDIEHKLHELGAIELEGLLVLADSKEELRKLDLGLSDAALTQFREKVHEAKGCFEEQCDCIQQLTTICLLSKGVCKRPSQLDPQLYMYFYSAQSILALPSNRVNLRQLS